VKGVPYQGKVCERVPIFDNLESERVPIFQNLVYERVRGLDLGQGIPI